MKILIVDTCGTGLSLAWRCAQAGHSVRWFVKPAATRSPEAGRGFRGIERIDNWVSSAGWADLVVATGADDYTERLDFFRNKGVKVFSPSAKSAMLNKDLKLQNKTLEKAGVDFLPWREFNSLAAAEAHAAKQPSGYEIRAGGQCYNAATQADAVNTLRRLQRQGAQSEGAVMLQERKSGVCCYVSRWFGSEGWVGPWNEWFRYWDDGCVGVYTPISKLAEASLAKLAEQLTALGHFGLVTAKVTVDESGRVYVQAVTAGMLWPLFYMLQGATKEDPAQWMHDAMSGKDTANFSSEVGMCVNVCVESAHGHGIPIYGITKGSKRYLHPQAVRIDVLCDMEDGKLVERPLWNTTGPHALTVTGFGRDVIQCTERAYKTVSQLDVHCKEFNGEVGADLSDKLDTLHELKFFEALNYAN